MISLYFSSFSKKFGSNLKTSEDLRQQTLLFNCTQQSFKSMQKYNKQVLCTAKLLNTRGAFISRLNMSTLAFTTWNLSGIVGFSSRFRKSEQMIIIWWSCDQENLHELQRGVQSISSQFLLGNMLSRTMLVCFFYLQFHASLW